MTALPEPWHEPWPAEDLEHVVACPLCGERGPALIHDDLVDNSFRTAPGHWRLWRCASCQATYLDPRPNAATIYRAYGSYYTHGSGEVPLSRLRELYRQLVHGYTNVRYGARLSPATAWGVLLIGSVPYLRRHADREYRHLPPLPTGGGRVLDVGCGDGAFLALARGCGWDVLGLEPDPKAALAAARRGLPVIDGDLARLDGQASVFDVITMAHVIEHVHDPVAVLRACHRLLKPGGTLWLETPNAGSLGLHLFAQDWRGLEAPRHLVLFTPAALRRVLRDAGFENCGSPPTPSVRRWMFQRSLAIRAGRRPDDTRPLPLGWLLRAWAGDLRETFGEPRGEFLTVTARKAG